MIQHFLHAVPNISVLNKSVHAFSLQRFLSYKKVGKGKTN